MKQLCNINRPSSSYGGGGQKAPPARIASEPESESESPNTFTLEIGAALAVALRPVKAHSPEE